MKQLKQLVVNLREDLKKEQAAYYAALNKVKDKEINKIIKKTLKKFKAK